MQNFWWYGSALMEAAATRSVHGDPPSAARMLIEVVDHWDRVGDWTEQWITLKYITRLLARLGADDDAIFLHCAFVKTGKPSPLKAAQLGVLTDRLGADRVEAHSASPDDGPLVVARARASLQRYATPATAPAV